MLTVSTATPASGGKQNRGMLKGRGGAHYKATHLRRKYGYFRPTESKFIPNATLTGVSAATCARSGSHGPRPFPRSRSTGVHLQSVAVSWAPGSVLAARRTWLPGDEPRGQEEWEKAGVEEGGLRPPSFWGLIVGGIAGTSMEGAFAQKIPSRGRDGCRDWGWGWGSFFHRRYDPRSSHIGDFAST